MQKKRTKSSPPQKTISPSRYAALQILEAVMTNGNTLLDKIGDLESLCNDSRDLALARDIVSGTCRWWGRIRYILMHAAPRLDHFPPTIQRILEMSTYQILYLDRVPEYAVLSDAVELARASQMGGLSAAVNGILRTLTRNRGKVNFPDAATDFAGFIASVHSHPKWLIEQWLTIWSREQVESLCQFNNTQAPLSLRLRNDRDAAMEKLATMGLLPQIDARFENRIILEGNARSNPHLFECNDWVAQDGGAMLIAPLLDPQPDWRIWDVCAAPGGKTIHLADLTQHKASILASDSHPERLKKLVEQKERLNLDSITVLKLDALQEQPPLDGGEFDAILVDAPCSGWGTFRRHPDLRWRLQNGDSKKFGRQALQILENVQKYLKKDGIMVYGTCTLSPEENEQVVLNFLDRHPNFQIEPIQSYLPPALVEVQNQVGCLSVFPSTWNMDGAFAARFRKR